MRAISKSSSLTASGHAALSASYQGPASPHDEGQGASVIAARDTVIGIERSCVDDRASMFHVYLRCNGV
jgi:hypothetical protein